MKKKLLLDKGKLWKHRKALIKKHIIDKYLKPLGAGTGVVAWGAVCCFIWHRFYLWGTKDIRIALPYGYKTTQRLPDEGAFIIGMLISVGMFCGLFYFMLEVWPDVRSIYEDWSSVR